MRLIPPIWILALVIAQPSLAREHEISDGAALVRENCSVCHAIGRSDLTRHSDAPPFRIISQRYSLDELASMMEAGRFFERHPQMPNFRMDQGTVRAIINYLRSIQD
jgi:mono/diheme cytochrome c family protein